MSTSQQGTMPDPSTGARLDTVTAQFTDAWESALKGSEPPALADYLARIPSPHREQVAAELARIDNDYRQRLTARLSSPTAPLPATLLQQLPPVLDTLDYRPDAAEATGSPSGTGPLSFSLSPEVTAAVSSRAAPPGYEILEELGRGGMGVVYKARQTALDRIVALKMILAGAHAGPGHLARFKIEAQAEARLQHANIVQIYEIGEHDGLPYFSLEYVSGGSLSRYLDRSPQPPREAAALVETLARAMHYAHQQGIVHRDLKPANILLAAAREDRPSLAAVPKIADFGLAKHLTADSTHTHSGTLLGTPSYMAPEQAAGQTRGVGPLADLYSLGALLYEMLAGRPPFQGLTLADTLEQVRSREPVPPRQLQPGVPLDLETICLKCLQKEPARRYGNCDTLADDLRRFLDGRPILARPVGSAERLYRWCRRNPRVALLGSAVLALLLTVAVISTTFVFLLARKQEETELARRDAVAASALAEHNADEAHAAQQLAEDNAHKAAHNADEAHAAQQLAEDNARLARDRHRLALEALDVVANKVQVQLEDLPETSGVREEILQTILKVLEEAVVHDDGTGLTGRGMAAAHLRLGEIFWLRNERQKAVDHFKLALTLTEQLWKQAPDSDKAAGNYAVLLIRNGDLFRDIKRDFATARSYYDKALALQEGAAAHPRGNDWPADEVQQAVAGTRERLANLALRVDNVDDARREINRALVIRDDQARRNRSLATRRALANVLYDLGQIAERGGDHPEALRRHETALTLRRDLASEQPARPRPKDDLVASCAALGDLYLIAGDAARARDVYRLAVEPGDQLAVLYPSVQHDSALSFTHYRLATAFLRLGERALAATHYARCLQIREGIIRKNGDNDARELHLMIARARCGQHAEAAATAAALAEGHPSDPEVLYHVACCYALCRDAVLAAGPPTSADRDLCQHYTEQALESLRRARSAGWKDLAAVEADPDLDPIRQEKGFAVLREDWKKSQTTPKSP